jgi:anti-anti-sigma regulatory factor
VVPQNSACVVTIVARDDRTVWMRLLGALDIDAEPVLTAAVTRLGELAPRRVVLDFAGVTFAGSALCHLLVRLHLIAPGASVLMQHTSPQARYVMAVTGTDDLVVHGDEPLP